MKKADSLYGCEFISYNVHCLIHLADDAIRFGHLDRISAFPFENMLGIIKNMLRKPGSKLIQIVNRTFEKNSFVNHAILNPKNDSIVPKFIHDNGPLIANFESSFVNQFTKLHVGGLVFSIRYPDNCLILNDSDVFLIQNIVRDKNSYFFIGKRFERKSNLFSFHLPRDVFVEYGIKTFFSSLLDIFKVSRLISLECISISEMKYKAVKIPLFPVEKKEYAIFPLVFEQND